MLPLIALLTGLLATAFFTTTNAAAAAHPPYSTWAASSAMHRGQGNGLTAAGAPTVSYEHGALQWALRLLYERTGNASYFAYIMEGVDNVVFENGTVGGGYSATQFQLDPLRVGPSFIYLYAQTGDARYKTAADAFHTQLMFNHSRTPEGQFWHKKIYPNQGWLDGVYMGDVFYATYVRAFQPHNTSAWDDITRQFTLMYAHTLQTVPVGNATALGLLYHGYDASRAAVWASPDRGHSPEVWDRALGWYAMALVDAIPLFPPTHPGHSALLGYLNVLLPRIARAADEEEGVWWLVLTQPGRAGNYFESSGAAMYVYALLRAVRLGYVRDPHGELVAAATKAYEYMVRSWVVDNGDGTMGWTNTVVVGSLDTDGSFDYYISQPTDLNDLKGVAAFILASFEYEELSR